MSSPAFESGQSGLTVFRVRRCCFFAVFSGHGTLNSARGAKRFFHAVQPVSEQGEGLCNRLHIDVQGIGLSRGLLHQRVAKLLLQFGNGLSRTGFADLPVFPAVLDLPILVGAILKAHQYPVSQLAE